jgi:hypothetical protein
MWPASGATITMMCVLASLPRLQAHRGSASVSQPSRPRKARVLRTADAGPTTLPGTDRRRARTRQRFPPFYRAVRATRLRFSVVHVTGARDFVINVSIIIVWAPMNCAHAIFKPLQRASDAVSAVAFTVDVPMPGRLVLCLCLVTKLPSGVCILLM